MASRKYDDGKRIVIGDDMDNIRMVIVSHDHPSAILRLKGSTNPNLAGEKLQKGVHQRSSDNIDSKAENSYDFDQNSIKT